MEFIPFPKVPRLSKTMVITEKLDGTNASIWIEPIPENWEPEPGVYADNGLLTGVLIRSGSRKRFLTRESDNFGFCNWVMDNAVELSKLGYGTHFGEWWGHGIQRGYGLTEKRFSLFNTAQWDDTEVRPSCCDVVPVLYRGPFDTAMIDHTMQDLKDQGSSAVPGYNNPEGIMVYHTAANMIFKKTFNYDEGKWKEKK